MRIDTTVNKVGFLPQQIKKSISLKSKVVKLLGLGMLFLSGSAFGSNVKLASMNSAPSLAQKCRKICLPINNLANISHIYLGQNERFVNNNLQPDCEGGYEKFSSHMSHFGRIGYFSVLLEKDFRTNRQWVCSINSEHQKPLKCLKKFFRIVHNKPQEETERLPFMINYDRQEVSHYKSAVSYAEKHMLKKIDFFDQPKETIISFIKKLNEKMREFENPIIGNVLGEFRADRTLVTSYSPDQLLDKYNSFYPNASTEERAEIIAFINLLKAAKITKMLEEIESSPKHTAVWENLLESIPPHHDLIPDLMNELIDELKLQVQERVHPYAIASEFYLRFTKIHPFAEGNGRTSRLFLNTFLASKGFQPLVFPDRAQFDYFYGENKRDPGVFTKYLMDIREWNLRNYQYLT